MTLLRFDPARSFETIARKMSDFTSEVEKGISFEFGSFSPRIDITENDKSLFVIAEIPGVKKQDVHLTVNDENILIIKGTNKAYDKNIEKKFVKVERGFGDFSRSFMLPDNIDKESISAKFENGVLTVTLAKKEPEAPKEIKIDIN